MAARRQPRARVGSVAAAAALAGALGVGGCAATVDPRSGEDLIRRVVRDDALGVLRDVSCPSGAQPRPGTVLACQIRLSDPTGRLRSGTVTVHVVAGRRVAITSASDFHLR